MVRMQDEEQWDSVCGGKEQQGSRRGESNSLVAVVVRLAEWGDGWAVWPRNDAPRGQLCLVVDAAVASLFGFCCCVQVKSFAAAAVGAPVAGYPCPPYKLLILDEADSMTQVSSALKVEQLKHSDKTLKAAQQAVSSFTAHNWMGCVFVAFTQGTIGMHCQSISLTRQHRCMLSVCLLSPRTPKTRCAAPWRATARSRASASSATTSAASSSPSPHDAQSSGSGEMNVWRRRRRRVLAGKGWVLRALGWVASVLALFGASERCPVGCNPQT